MLAAFVEAFAGSLKWIDWSHRLFGVGPSKFVGIQKDGFQEWVLFGLKPLFLPAKMPL